MGSTNSGKRIAARITMALMVIWVAVLKSVGPAAAAPPMAAETEVSDQQRAALYARPAVMYMEMAWSVFVDIGEAERIPLEFKSRCTGFVVNPNGYVVSAGHCVDPSTEPGGIGFDVLLFLVEELYPLYADQFPTIDEFLMHAVTNWEIEGLFAGSMPAPQIHVIHSAALGAIEAAEGWPARLLEFIPSARGDVALLKLEQSKLPAVELATDVDVQVGMPVLSIGYPGSSDLVTDVDQSVNANLDPTFKDGRISSIKTRNSYKVFETSAALSGGMSGGPTIDLDGRVIGVNSFGPAGEPQAFNFLSSVDLVNEILTRNGVEAGLSSIDESYRAGVDAYLAGDHEVAIEHFETVLDRLPNHVQATELRISAQDALAEQAETSGDAEHGGRTGSADSGDEPNTGAEVGGGRGTLDRPVVTVPPVEQAAPGGGVPMTVVAGAGLATAVLLGLAVRQRRSGGNGPARPVVTSSGAAQAPATATVPGSGPIDTGWWQQAAPTGRTTDRHAASASTVGPAEWWTDLPTTSPVQS